MHSRHTPWYILIILFGYSCQLDQRHTNAHTPQAKVDTNQNLSYKETKNKISGKRTQYATQYFKASETEKKKIRNKITGFWISGISDNLYRYWAGTPWDFNGNTLIPQKGAIACGFFVTTILQDMDVALNRTKLSICASSEMMKALVPHQRLMNMSKPAYDDFVAALKKFDNGVYVIGLDFHTGFIIVDNGEAWFLHSNYINRQGVVNEPVKTSAALRTSKTRWLVNLTGDDDFINRWLRGIKT